MIPPAPWGSAADTTPPSALGRNTLGDTAEKALWYCVIRASPVGRFHHGTAATMVSLGGASAPKGVGRVSAAVTMSEEGAVILKGSERFYVSAIEIKELVDTTGAGDLFAAGFLFGYTNGKSLEQSLKLGAIAAAEVIQHYGARPEADLRALAGELAA